MSHEEKFHEMMQGEPESLPLYADVDAPQDYQPTEFHIDSESAANWYLRKLANIESEKQRVTANAAAIVRQLESEADGLRYCYEGELQNYVRRELAAKGSRRKSLTLLQGTAAFRSVPAALKISDPAAALRYAVSSLPAAVTTRPALDAEKYRAAAESAAKTGQTLPGVETVPARETFRVTFGGKAE